MGAKVWKRRWAWVVVVATFAVVATACVPPAAPTAPTGVGVESGAPPAPGSPRDVTRWPFAASSPWNMPLGSLAAFDTRPIVSTSNCTPWINSSEYSVPVVRAAAEDPLVTIQVSGGSHPGPVSLRIPVGARPAAGSDAHLAVIAPDGLHADEFWALDLVGRTAGASITVDLTGSGVGIGWVRATGVSLLGGLIRADETTSIPHALAISLPYDLLAGGYVWPAISYDSGGAPGTVPQGALLAIPPGTPRPAGLSPLGNAVFDALAHYGAYVVDQTGGGSATLYAEPTIDQQLLGRAIGDMASILPLVRRVTNNGPGTVGGPGGRVAPLAP